MMALLSGKKTYLLLAAYALLVLFGQVPEGGIEMPDMAKLQDLVLAGALATLRAGVTKVKGT